MAGEFPKGKFMAMVKIGSKGQIVIPKEVREMFNFKPGDSLLLLADINQGVGLQSLENAEKFWEGMNKLIKQGGNK